MTRRQILGRATIVATLGMPAGASACSRAYDTPFTARFWQRLWHQRILGPGQARAVLHGFVEGILHGSHPAIAELLAPESYVFYPPTAYYQPGPGTYFSGAAAVDHLARIAGFARNQHYVLEIITLRPGEYLLVADLYGSGVDRRSGNDGWSVCGEDPARHRSIKLCAQVSIDFGGTGRIQRAVMV